MGCNNKRLIAALAIKNMENEDLIRKLKNTELPDIEIKNHKIRLRMALLSSGYFKKPGFLEIIKKSLIFAVPASALLIILGVTVIQPKLSEAKALSIAKNNPEIKKLMAEKNMVLTEVKLKDGRVYVLLNPLQETELKTEKNPAIKIQKTEEDKLEDIEGAIIEVNLGKKEVAKINPIRGDDIVPLANQEKESAKEIAGTEEVIKDIIPKEARIEKIQAFLPQKIHLVDKDHQIEVEPNPLAEKRASVHYNLDGKKWVIRVNLDEKRVEEIQYSSSVEQFLKGRDKETDN